LMSYSYGMLCHIGHVVEHKLAAKFVTLQAVKLTWDVAHGMQLSFSLKSEFSVGNPRMTVTWNDLFLDSGWVFTSGVNFLNELSGFLCSVVEDIETLFMQAKNGRFRCQFPTGHANAHPWVFQSVPLYFTADGPVESREILIRVFCEGDDLVGGSPGSYLTQETQGSAVL